MLTIDIGHYFKLSDDDMERSKAAIDLVSGLKTCSRGASLRRLVRNQINRSFFSIFTLINTSFALNEIDFGCPTALIDLYS